MSAVCISKRLRNSLTIIFLFLSTTQFYKFVWLYLSFLSRSCSQCFLAHFCLSKSVSFHFLLVSIFFLVWQKIQTFTLHQPFHCWLLLFLFWCFSFPYLFLLHCLPFIQRRGSCIQETWKPVSQSKYSKAFSRWGAVRETFGSTSERLWVFYRHDKCGRHTKFRLFLYILQSNRRNRQNICVFM